jgi:calcineurin-like phosphoesterase family protein
MLDSINRVIKYDPWKVQKLIDNVWYMFHKNSYKRSNEMFTWDELQSIYVISDTHFWHRKIKEYCGRPDRWYSTLIDNWNRKVGTDDTVLHLGDFALGNFNRTKAIRSFLNGNIYLVKGNHDRHGKQWYADAGITVIPSFMIQEKSKTIYFTHRPIKTEGFYGINIHGHTHEKGDFVYSPHKNAIYVNMSVEHTNFTPMKFRDIMKATIKYLH